VALLIAGVHPGPPVFLQVAVADGQVGIQFSAEQRTALPWLGEEGLLPPPLDDAARERLEDAALRLLGEELRISIDGAPVKLMAVSRVQVFNQFGPDNAEPSIQIDAQFACAGTPRSVAIAWQYYDAVEDGKRKLPVVIDAEGEFDFKTLTEEEPEYVWHTSAAPNRRAAAGAAPAALPEGRSPVLPLVLFALGIGLWGLGVRRGMGRGAGWLLAVPMALGVWIWSRGPGGPELPGDEQARAMFETLHGNLYAAFDARSEDEIYEQLALCVDPALLDQLYGEIYESLILREDGGALCRVEEVAAIDGEVLPSPAGGASFDVDWTWRVTGQVVHYGHEHRRTNEYHARYTVAPVRTTWRIVGVEVLSHERVDPEDEG